MAAVRKLVVLVDDDIDFLDPNALILEEAGFEVTRCLSADEAVECASERIPDLIVTDLMMGALDAGFTFSRRVKADPRLAGVPVIIVTSAASSRGFDFRPRGAEDLAAMSADAFLRKPVDAQEFVRTVRSLTGSGRPGDM